MTAHRMVFLSCDGTENLGAPCESAVDLNRASGPKNAAQARTEARRGGWHHTREGRDLCAGCWAEGQR